MLSKLPQDVIFSILSRLPTKALIQFRCVSKSCPPLISHPDFIKLHFSPGRATADHHHLLIYYESIDYTHHCYSLRSATTLEETLKLEVPFKSVHGYLRIVGSSKGLICFFDTNYYTYIGRVIFWNPSIKKVKLLPDSHLIHEFPDSFSHMVVGFGFVSRITDFKVVQILYDVDKEATNYVLVYCLGSNSWRKVVAKVPCFIPKCWSSNVFLNGFVNWLGYKRPKVNGTFDSIMGFDMMDEVFKVIELPKNRSLSYDQICLSSSMCGQTLCLCFHYMDAIGDKWDVWVMEEYGVAESWKKICSVVRPLLSPPPLSIRGDGEVLLVTNDGKLVLCDAIKEQMKDLDICGLPSSFRVVHYTSSLALLDG